MTIYADSGDLRSGPRRGRETHAEHATFWLRTQAALCCPLCQYCGVFGVGKSPAQNWFG